MPNSIVNSHIYPYFCTPLTNKNIFKRNPAKPKRNNTANTLFYFPVPMIKKRTYGENSINVSIYR